MFGFLMSTLNYTFSTYKIGVVSVEFLPCSFVSAVSLFLLRIAFCLLYYYFSLNTLSSMQVWS